MLQYYYYKYAQCVQYNINIYIKYDVGNIIIIIITMRHNSYFYMAVYKPPTVNFPSPPPLEASPLLHILLFHHSLTLSHVPIKRFSDLLLDVIKLHVQFTPPRNGPRRLCICFLFPAPSPYKYTYTPYRCLLYGTGPHRQGCPK